MYCCLLTISLFAGDDPESYSKKKHSAVSETGVEGKFMVTCGAGFNFMGEALKIQYGSSTYWNRDYSYRAIDGNAPPMLNVALDYGFSRRFSAGLSFGCQTVRLAVLDSNLTTGKAGLTYADVWQRYHVAVRGDYYLVAKPKVNIYTGLKIGYNSYSMTSTRDNVYPGYTQQLNVHPSSTSVQAHIGASFYYRSVIGFNAEFGLGIGGPYVFALGAALKIP